MIGIEFPRVERPIVSVVMVTYGRWDWITRAFDALVKHTPPIYEVIVVDNASPDGTGERLAASLTGARLIRNEKNFGFGAGVNIGASHSAGRFLCILNSDALVQPGWLEPTLELLERDASVASVVPRYLSLDGTLQEAGALVSGDGTTVALGAGEDPEAFEYRFPREVDYGTAACMLVRRSAFVEVGGFDPAYPMGYCEDVDFGFRLQEKGLRTVYEPRSRVAHAGGASSTPWEIERLVGLNTRVLRARWPHKLARRPSLAERGAHPYRVIAARDAEINDRVLVVAREVPPGEGSRAGWLLARLVSRWPNARVTLLAADAARAGEFAPAWLEQGIEVACAPADANRWFRERLLHESVVIVMGAACAAAFGADVRTTQPQAFVAYDLDRGDATEGGTQLRSTDVEAMRSAGAVFCATEAERLFAQGLAGDTPCFLLPASDEGEPILEQVMARAGLAPAAPARTPA